MIRVLLSTALLAAMVGCQASSIPAGIVLSQEERTDGSRYNHPKINSTSNGGGSFDVSVDGLGATVITVYSDGSVVSVDSVNGHASVELDLSEATMVLFEFADSLPKRKWL